MGLSLPLGLVVGVLLVLLFGYMDDTIHSEGDIAELKLIYLGRMPAGNDAKQRASRKRA